MAEQDETVDKTEVDGAIEVHYMEMTVRCDCGLAASRLIGVRFFADGTLSVIAACAKNHTPVAATANVYELILKLQNDQPTESAS